MNSKGRIKRQGGTGKGGKERGTWDCNEKRRKWEKKKGVNEEGKEVQ